MARATGRGTTTLGLNAGDRMITRNGYEGLADLSLALAMRSLRRLDKD
jgi:hypothetical protein